MNTTYMVEVTQRDIDDGEPRNCYMCPVALALQRVTGLSVDVDGPILYLFPMHASKLLYCYAPVPVRAFMNRFDTGKPVQPFTFEAKFQECRRRSEG